MSISFHQREPSSLEFLSKSLGQGLGTGIGEHLQFARQHKEEERLKQIQAEEIGSLQERLKSLGPNASPFDKFAAIAASATSDKTKASALEALKYEGARDFTKRLREGNGELSVADIIEGEALGYIPAGSGQELIRQQGKIPQAKQVKQIENTYGMPEGSLEGLDVKDAFKSAQDIRENNKKLDTQISEQGKEIATNIRDLNELENLINKGAFDPLSWANFADKMEESGHPLIGAIGRAFESGDAGRANSLIKNLYTGLLRSIPAKGVNIFVERILRNMLPLMGKSKEANLAVVDSLKKAQEALALPSTIRKEILQEHHGQLPWNFGDLYYEKLRERSDALIEEAINLGENAIDKYGKQEEGKPSERKMKQVYDKKTGKLLGTVPEEDISKVDTNLYILK